MDARDDVIRSRTNAALKRVGLAARGRLDGTVLLEGERLVKDALRAGLEPDLLLVREDRSELMEDLPSGPLRLVAASLFERLGTLTTPPGVLGLFQRPALRGIADLGRHVGTEGSVLLLGIAGVSDPGNLGALARCAEAAGATGLVITAGSARPFTPKALRGSMGSLLRLPIFEVDDLAAAVAELDERRVQQCMAATRDGQPLDTFDFKDRTLVWMTSETGDAPSELDSSAAVTIPMAGEVESLNVTVAGALLLFAAARRAH